MVHELLARLSARGVSIVARDDLVELEGPAEALTPEVVEEVRAGKAKLIQHLRQLEAGRPSPPSSRDADAWRDYHAGFLTWYRGRYGESLAAVLAFGECVEAWSTANPIPPSPGRCAGCNGILGGEALEMGAGAAVHWESERGFDCVIEYGRRRISRAVERLAEYGVSRPTQWELP